MRVRVAKYVHPLDHSSIAQKTETLVGAPQYWLPYANRNTYSYMLTIVYEYFVSLPLPKYAYKNSNEVFKIKFTLCGMPSFIHSDQGLSFMSRELKVLQQAGQLLTILLEITWWSNIMASFRNPFVWRFKLMT